MPEHWEEEGPYGHPIVATLAGGAILVLAALLGPRFASPLPLPTLLIGGAAAGLVLWLIGFLATTRHSNLLWKLGSLLLLIGAGVGAAMVAHGQFQTRSRADASSFAEIDLASDGSVMLPQGIVDRGPVSALYAQAVQAEAADTRAFTDALAKFGAPSLNSPYLLEQNPKPIQDCAALDNVRALAVAQSAKRLDRRAALARAIGSASLPVSAKQGVIQIVGDAKSDPTLANQQALLDATAELCRLLARKSWVNANAYFGFPNGADGAAFKAIGQKRIALSVDADAIARAERARILAGREQVRGALSHSIYTKE
jgi:hypothetical protein